MTFDSEKARKNLRQRYEERNARLRSLAAEAQRDAQRIITMLVDSYHPVRIYQWGSLLDVSRFREWSDIDIALEGLQNPLDGLRAIDSASDMTQFRVDIVELERIHPLHAETIRKEGRLVYERKTDE